MKYRDCFRRRATRIIFSDITETLGRTPMVDSPGWGAIYLGIVAKL